MYSQSNVEEMEEHEMLQYGYLQGHTERASLLREGMALCGFFDVVVHVQGAGMNEDTILNSESE